MIRKYFNTITNKLEIRGGIVGGMAVSNCLSFSSSDISYVIICKAVIVSARTVASVGKIGFIS